MRYQELLFSAFVLSAAIAYAGSTPTPALIKLSPFGAGSLIQPRGVGIRLRGQPGRSLGAQHRLQRGHIVRERIIGGHRRPENHNTPSLSELPIVLSIQIPAPRPARLD